MKLWSDSFRNGGFIPAEFAFAEPAPVNHVTLAGNRNPHLAWDDVPNGTESLALFCIDGDAPLDASNVNHEGKSVALNTPRGDFFHWSLLDLPLSVRVLGAGQFSSGVTARGKSGAPVVSSSGVSLRQGLNDYSGWFAGDPDMAGAYYGYDGPCPPWNDERLHHYIFRLYALDVPRLALAPGFSGQQALAALHGHIIDEAQLIGAYALNPGLTSTLKK